MTDPDLLAKKLAYIEGCVRDLRTLADLSRLRSDIKERRFVEHTLQVAVQAALDVASHIVSDEKLGEPRTNRELFAALSASDWLERSLSTRLEAAAGLRNGFVHGYADVELEILRDVVEHRLGDLIDFVSAIRARLA